MGNCQSSGKPEKELPVQEAVHTEAESSIQTENSVIPILERVVEEDFSPPHAEEPLLVEDEESSPALHSAVETETAEQVGDEAHQNVACRGPSSVGMSISEGCNADRQSVLRPSESLYENIPAQSTAEFRSSARVTVRSTQSGVFENIPDESTAACRWDVKNVVQNTETVFENTPEKSAADFCCGRVAATLDTMEANVAPFSVRDAAKKFENTKEFDDLKKTGFEFFTAKDYDNAFKFFTKAINLNDKDPGLYSIRSATAMRLGNFNEAIRDAAMCIKLSPEWCMGYCRMGLALMRKGDCKAAIEAFEKGLLLEPTDVTMQQGIAKAKAHDGTAEPVIGIDLGTSKTSVGIWIDGRVEILSDECGRSTMPSCVAWTSDGERLLGQRASRQADQNLERTIFGVKRLIGQKMTDPKVQEFVSHLPYKVTSGNQNQPLIQIDDRLLTPEEISAMFLGQMKKIAEERLGTPVKKAVITTPACFNDAQRQATKAAGEIAGLDVVRMINEPTAAAIAYGVNRKNDSNVLVYDLGGGYFDASILRIEDGIFEVKATGGDAHLGGEDFNNGYVAFLVQELKTKYDIDVKEDKHAMGRLQITAELSKRDLSVNMSSTVSVTFMDKQYDINVKRSQFEDVNEKSFARTITIVEQVLKDAKMDVKDVDEVVLVGGSTHIPKIQEMLQKFFNGKELWTSVNPEEAVAVGVSVQAALLGGVTSDMTDSLLLVDVTSLSLGLELDGHHMSAIIPRNTRIPCKCTEMYTTTVDKQTSLQVRIFEGERVRTAENRLLGEFSVHGIEKGKKGTPRIAVTFSLDNNGILHVTALDRRTGAKADCTINDAHKA